VRLSRSRLLLRVALLTVAGVDLLLHGLRAGGPARPTPLSARLALLATLLSGLALVTALLSTLALVRRAPRRALALEEHPKAGSHHPGAAPQ